MSSHPRQSIKVAVLIPSFTYNHVKVVRFLDMIDVGTEAPIKKANRKNHKILLTNLACASQSARERITKYDSFCGCFFFAAASFVKGEKI